MILVPPKTLDWESSAPTEDYPVWGGDVYHVKNYSALPEKIGTQEQHVWENFLTKDVFCSVGNRLYKQTAGAGAFALLTTMGRPITCLTGDYSTGRLYVGYRYSDISPSSIKSIDPLTGVQALVSAEISDASPANGVAVDPATGLLYWTTLNDLYVSDPYVDDETPIETEPYTTGVFTTDLHGVAIDDVSGRIYVLGESHVWFQVGFTGTWTPVVVEDGARVSVSRADHSVYVAKDDGSVVVRTGETGTFSLAIEGLTGVTSLFASDGLFAADGDADYPLKFYGSTFYNTDDFSIVDDRIYVSLINANKATPGTDDTKWFDYGPTNPGKMFDELLISKTEDPGGNLYFTVMGPDIDTIGLFNLSGADSVTLRVFDSDGLVSTTTQAVGSRNLAFNDVADGLVYEINIYGTLPACGGVVAGVASDIGALLWGVNIELVSYSKVVFDDFGRATFTRRGRAKKMTCPVWAQMSEVDRLYELFNANDAKRCMWQGTQDDDYLLVYGHYKRFDMGLSQNSGTKYGIEILGDVDTE